MGNKTTNLLKEDHATGHKWVHYSNPRNGRIQIIACKNCGTMLAGALAARPCVPKHAQNPIESKGWIIKAQHSELRPQDLEASI